MKRIGLTIILLLFAQSALATQGPGFYFGFYGGYVMPQTMSFSDPDDGFVYFDSTLENGYLLAVKTGWLTPFTRNTMAMEIEYNYMNNDFDNSRIIPSPDHPGDFATLDGNMSIHALLFNVKARYPAGPVHPYAGFGLGYAYTSIGDIVERQVGGAGLELWRGESGGGFCWQFLAGVDVDIAPHMSLSIGYKYFTAYPREVGHRYYNYYVDLDYRASMITMGLTFTF